MATGRVLDSCPGCPAAVRHSRLGPQLFVSAAMHQLREAKTKLLTTPSSLLRMCGGGGGGHMSASQRQRSHRTNPGQADLRCVAESLYPEVAPVVRQEPEPARFGFLSRNKRPRILKGSRPAWDSDTWSSASRLFQLLSPMVKRPGTSEKNHIPSSGS